ncbi:transposase family protein [Nonomuraea dietziae]|uniref:transposase family protein n=1 Tax=Nonomuraea dietziae TaxID=65515 RepID=UPI0031D97BFB
MRAAGGGRRYRLGPLLALSLLAVLGGATSLAKIARFIAGYDPELRARAGLPGTVRLAASTLGRLFSRLDGDAFDTATCTYLAALADCGPHSTIDIRPRPGRRSPAWPWTARPCAAAAPRTVSSICWPPPATTPRSS